MIEHKKHEGEPVPHGKKKKQPEPVIEEQPTPYPWCHGNPTRQDCIERGYCGRNPNCGE